MSTRRTDIISLRRGGQRRRGAFAALLFTGALPTIANAQASLTIIKSDPPGQEPDRPFLARTIDDDGNMVGLYNTFGKFRAVIRNYTGDWVVLPVLQAGDQSNVGYSWQVESDIPGWIVRNNIWYPVVWVDSVTISQPVEVPPLFPSGGAVAGADANAEVLGGIYLWTLSSGTGWTWSQKCGAQFTSVGPGGPAPSSVGSVSFDGSVVTAHELTAQGWQTVLLFSNGQRQYSGFLPGGSETAALLMTPDAAVRVGYADDGVNEQGVRWTDAHGLQVLGHINPAVPSARAAAVSHDGWTVVGRSYEPGPITPTFTAFVWNPIDGMRSLEKILQDDHGINVEKYNLGELYAISGNGRYMQGFGVELGTTPAKFINFLVELPAFCYADCDRGTGKGVLDVFDFICYMSHFDQQDVYSNCNNDGAIDFFDFLCFINKWQEGCQ